MPFCGAAAPGKPSGAVLQLDDVPDDLVLIQDLSIGHTTDCISFDRADDLCLVGRLDDGCVGFEILFLQTVGAENAPNRVVAVGSALVHVIQYVLIQFAFGTALELAGCGGLLKAGVEADVLRTAVHSRLTGEGAFRCVDRNHQLICQVQGFAGTVNFGISGDRQQPDNHNHCKDQRQSSLQNLLHIKKPP